MKRLRDYLHVLWHGTPDRLTKEHVPTIPEPDPYAEKVYLDGTGPVKRSTFPAVYSAHVTLDPTE